MMTCPKCGGTSIFDARDDAPFGTKDYVRCCICGKRWDPTKDAMATITKAFNEWQPDEEKLELGEDDEKEPDLTDLDEGDDLDQVDETETPTVLAMRDASVKRERPKKERATMPKFQSEEHRKNWLEGQRLARELKKKAAGGGHVAAAKPKRAYKKKEKTPAAAVPAVVKRSAVTVLAAEPVSIAGDALNVLDAAIAQLKQDTEAVERARFVVARMQG